MTAPAVPFTRTLHTGVPPDVDVVGVKRAVSRAGFWPWASPFNETYTLGFANNGIKPFQKAHGLEDDGVYGKDTHEKLRTTHRDGHPDEWAFDEVAILAMKSFDPGLQKAKAMLAFCRLFDGPYVYGGEHDASFADDDVHDGFDCSSSTSFVLWRFGLLGSTHAQISSWFETWGQAGRGDHVTVHANGDHVWMEFDIDGAYYRFDTSPHGDGSRGPRVRTRVRSDSGFVHRHPKGM